MLPQEKRTTHTIFFPAGAETGIKTTFELNPQNGRWEENGSRPVSRSQINQERNPNEKPHPNS